MHDWDDLRHFIAAVRHKSLTGAASRLGVDAATVGRRIARLEAVIRSTVFIRSRRGLELTSSGNRLFQAALEVEAAMTAVQRASERDVVGGTVRLSAAEGFGTVIVAPALPDLRRARPSLRIELAAQSGFLSPSRREADIAITLSAPLENRLVVEPLTDYELGLFASADYLAKAGLPKSIVALKQHQIVGYIDDLIYASELRYLEEIDSDLHAMLASTSIRAQREMIAAGGGIGVLPLFMATGLRRVLAKQIQIKRRFWLSTHRDVADTARVRIVREWLKDLVMRRRRILAPAS